MIRLIVESAQTRPQRMARLAENWNSDLRIEQVLRAGDRIVIAEEGEGAKRDNALTGSKIKSNPTSSYVGTLEVSSNEV